MNIYQPYQRTIKNPISCVGIGLHSGTKSTIRFMPAPENHGIVFKRVDVTDKNNLIKADYRNVVCTMLGTTIANDDGIKVLTVEHLMAALWGCHIDNCLIEIDNEEIPIMDGSSEPFVFLIECSGIQEQTETRTIIEVLKTVEVEEEYGKASISPADSFIVNLEIDFNDKVVSKQSGSYNSMEFSFKNDLCRARTFGFAHEVEKLRSIGLARGGSLENAIVVGKDSILNKDGLRYKDEFVRHKILDCIGDFYLSGFYLKGALNGFKSGHSLNNKLLRTLLADSDAWRMNKMPHDTSSVSVQYN
ncbi:MAG: UDP-3-O-acyl-N-acetylglucosamine deacetylase [Rickettsiales bacterium]|nr:UDP-3-O-acyl-N-acetylglucosamine deacetylase [Rickettsiales bacterium]